MTADSDRVWLDDMAAVYDRDLVPTVFRPFALEVASRIEALSPTSILELAAGTGVLTAELASVAHGATIVATDLNPAMVEVGRERAPHAEWRTADAMTLPFADNSFDLVACQFGLMFLPDKVGAFREVRRVLRAGGRFLASVWARLERHDFESTIVDATDRLFAGDPPRFLRSVPHGYSEPETIHSDLTAAGLEPLSLEQVTLEGQAASASDIARGYATGTPLLGELQARGDVQASLEAIREALERRFGTGPVAGRMTAVVVEARAPTG